jgi:hypothetical protein
MIKHSTAHSDQSKIFSNIGASAAPTQPQAVPVSAPVASTQPKAAPAPAPAGPAAPMSYASLVKREPVQQAAPVHNTNMDKSNVDQVFYTFLSILS